MIPVLNVSIFLQFQNMAQQLHASHYVHNAPAGSRYSSILDAGRTILEEKCHGFLRGNSHVMLPPILINVYPEQVGTDGCIKPGPRTAEHDKQLKGATVNKLGEDFEVSVFRRFEQLLSPNLIDSSLQECHILWRSFMISGYKVDALLNEHPKLHQKVLDFRKKYTTKKGRSFGECDMVVLIKNVGLVIIEIKCSRSKFLEATKQCNRMAHFASIVFESCAPDATIPIAKVVVLGESPLVLGESQEKSVSRDASFVVKDVDKDVWIFYKEATDTEDNFEDCWKQVLSDLKHSKMNSNPTSYMYDELASSITGLWSMVECHGSVSHNGK